MAFYLVLLLVPGPLRALGVDEDLQEVEQQHRLTGYLCKYKAMGERHRASTRSTSSASITW